MNRPDAVIFSHRGDEHAMAVLSALSPRVCPVLIDVGREGVDFVTTYDDLGRLSQRDRSGGRHDLNSVGFWWNRRPRFRGHPGSDGQFGLAQETEVTNFWTGIWGNAPPGCWCNPWDTPIARNKLRQVFLARECGLATPRTIWSNDAARIGAFRNEQQAGAVIKMFEGTDSVWEPTRQLDDIVMSNPAALRFSPAIVQSFMPGDREHRVVIFGDECFGVSTRVGSSRYAFDARIDMAAEKEPARLDTDLRSRLQEFMRRSGLTYAAFDIRDDPDGQPVFLEVNPMGQFLYLDRVLDGQVLKAFCAFIERHALTPAGMSLPERSPSEAPSNERWEGSVLRPFFEVVGDRVRHIP